MAQPEYNYKSTPFKHQRDLFLATRDLPRYGLFWEQGCGKTKPTLDTAAYLFLERKIDGLLVLAPNGVHRNWVSDEIPAHLSVPAECLCYQTGKAGTVAQQRAADSLLCSRSLAVLAMSYDSFMTERGKKLAHKFLETRKCLYVLDEAARIKSISAKRTKSILASAKLAQYRRVLTGTPIANGPFDAYSIMKFLDLGFWKPYCLDSYFIFKHHFGVWKQGINNAQGGRAYEYVVGYRNLEQLYGILAQHSSRVTKDQVLDLPPKLYSTRYFELTPEQRRLYEQIEREFMVFLEDQGELITAPLVITRLLRFQQITSGYIPSDAGDPIYNIGETNPRLKLLEEVLEDTPHKAIIWAKFRRDIDSICTLLEGRCVRYDGAVGPQQRADAIKAFQTGATQFFVANPAAAGEGLTLHAARSVIYYNNSFKLTDRLQSEDRAHRIGQAHPVNYIDLVAEGTIDEHITKSLVKKSDIASKILGDKVREWFQHE